jgi:arylsulfatase A-like enzyme
MRLRATAFSLLVASAVLAGPVAQPRPGILLITLDTTRADRMGFLGSTRGLTPALDAFARTATVFSRAYAQAPVTTVSHATLLTGTYPLAHHVDQLGASLPTSVPYVPELLQRQGYRTAAFVGSLVLDPKNGTAPGFERGFDVYDAGFQLRRPGEDRYQTVERRGDEVVRRAVDWLKGVGSHFRWTEMAPDPSSSGCTCSSRMIPTIRRRICVQSLRRRRTTARSRRSIVLSGGWSLRPDRPR